MPLYEIKAPNGRVYRIKGPPNATDAQVKAKILAQYPEAGIPKPAPPRVRGTGIGAVDAVMDNINEILIGVPKGAYDLGAMVTDPISGMIFGKDAVKKAQAQRRDFFDKVSRTFVTKPRPMARLVGETIGPGGAVTGTAKTLARLAPKIPKIGKTVAKVLESTARGGIGVRGASRPGTVALKVAGGGTSGAATAALMGESPEEIAKGAMYGAGVPVLGTIIRKLGGKAIDLTRMPKVQAGKIIREALGKDVDAARAALAALSPDDQRLLQQVMIDAGVEPSPFFGLGKIVAKQRDPDTPVAILARQKAARDSRLAEAAGGNTMEAIRAAVRGERAAVTQNLAPVREEMYRRAGAANEIVPVAERTARQATQAADEITASGLVPRMRGLEDRSRGQIDAAFQNPEFFTLGGPVNRIGEIAEGAGQRADDAINAQIGLRDTARDLYQMVDDMASQGMQPMRAADLIASLRRKMADPEILRGSVEEGTIKGVIRQLEKATDANGMLNPKALGKIRRSGINTLVNKLSTQMGGVPSRTGTPEAAQGTVLELRELIDETLRRGGGGDLVDEFLLRSERGYAAVNRQQLAGEAFSRYQFGPKTGDSFLKLVRGGEPKTVGKIMGGGPENEKIANAFAGDTKRLNALTTSADELEKLNKMDELASRGTTRAQNIITEQQPGKLSRHLGSILRAKYPSISFAGTGTEGAASAYVAPKVLTNLAETYHPGPNMGAAINQFPAATRMSEQMQNVDPTVRNVMAQTSRQLYDPSMDRQRADIAARFNFPEIDTVSGDPLIDIGFSEGQPFPVYGKMPKDKQFQNINLMGR